MAERPLYTLYKNLKAQNYDVPDDYNKFESALTRDGKGGADNRHAIYENLKAQNFDVPNTYERFYSALFEPRSKTSSRAKGGSVPMSAVDRARFSAGAAAISASANNAVRQAKRNIQTKLGQAKKFNGGRVSPRLKNPLQNQNVQKNEFNYNSTTGKTGTYTTTDGVEFNNEYDAAQYQNQLDKQGEQYINAVNTGEIPSVFDVRDKNGNYDLQENINKNGTYLTEEGARNQFDKKLADAYARKKEIEALIAEDHRQHGNPLLSYGASIGASNGRTAEQSDYSNKLATSLALVKQQIGALEAVKQYPTSSWGEDALKALDNTAFTAKTWDFGLTDFATMGQMERIKTKMDNNLPISGSDKMLLKSKLGADAAAALEDEKMGNIYRWTKIAGQSLPFMADFFLTGGYGGITKAISRGALKFAAKRGMGKVSAAILKNTGIVAGDVIGSYAMAGSEQAMKTGADIMQRHLGSLYQDEKGDYKFGTFDENGNLMHEGGESMGTALYKGLTSAMVENYTEKLFGHSYGIKKGAINFMEKHGMNASAEFFKNIGKSGWYTNSKKWMEKFGINGFGEEVMEEEIGIPLHALLDGDNEFSDLLDTKQQLDIIGGMALSVGSMYAMGAGSRPVKGVYNRAQYYRFRNKVNVADSDAQNLMGDKWADIKDKIDNTTNEQMGGVLADILRQRDTMSKEQINAAINYGINLMKMRGYNVAKTAEMNAREITNEPTTPEEQHQEDIDNAYSEGHDADDADKHDIQLEHEDQMKTLAGLLNISEQQLSAMNDDELQSLTGQNDKLDQAIYDYQLSSARYQGVTDDAQDKIDMAANQAAQRVDMYTDKSRGSVRNATVKASGGAEDYGVYIISGNIATNEDGSINVADSDDMILFYDPTTNSVEHADALRFAELGDEVPADDVKAQAVADAKENAIKEVAGIVDGTIDVGSQFKVTGADGLEHTYEILADYGDGTAAISIDGNVVENPYSLEDLQQLKDLEDQKKLEAAKAKREQMENERAAQQTEQTQETEQSEETQPSLDFDQILNDNGNVVLVDVLGKDGNTKYPSSQLFLIRDSGAKAKVMELKSDGTLVPHAVNKKDVRTATTMTLDEYKQAMAESSMIEENSGENRGEIEVETPAIEGETAAPAEEAAAPESAETPATEQTPGTPAMTLEDGTIVPMLEDGNPDFSKLTADQTAELYDSQFGEDADSVISGWVSDAKKALDKANNMTVKGKNFVEQKAAKEAKERAIADAQTAYNSAVAIRDAYNSRQLAKVEDDAEGRKNLIEKARRKFARLKSAVKDDAEAVSQLYKDVVGSLLHRLYDDTGIDVTDTIPLTAEEYVASNLGAHSLNYEGTETSKGVKQETGLSREDFAKTQLLAADGKGTTIDDLVHSLWENRPSNLESLDTQDIRNALIGVLTSGFKASEARNYIENLRIAQAENILEEQKKAAENSAFAEENKAETEQQTETAPESEEKTEVDNSDEINDEENEQTNENINAPEVPEDATEENPLGAQRDQTELPFSARDNGTQQTTAERAADVEKNKVDDMKVVDNIVGEKTRKAFERLAKMMGANIQWQYSDKLGNGWIQETTDADGNVHRTIFITLDSSITEGSQFIFGHEMTHQIKRLNPAAYNELTQLVLDTYGSDAFDKAIDETMKRYSDAGFSGRARDYYAEEVVADAVGEMIRDLNLAHTLAMKMSHPLLAAIHEILQKIKLAFYGTEYSDVIKNIIRSIEQAYVKTANGEVTNTETGEDVSFSLRLKSAIEETETNPSDAQKESGNYKKGHIKFGGYDYTIENPKGSTRSGKDADGKEWKVTMHDTYGYIRGKFGKDGDHLDMFINDKADLDNWNGDVFVVDQVNPDGSFDEHKVMYGYDSMDDAKKAYLANYSDGWQGLGNITGASKDEFDKWLDTSNRKLKPFADYAKVKFSLKDIKPVGVGAFGNIYNQFRGNAKDAIEFLKKVRGGEAVGALHHKDIGDIDLVWGKEGTGHSDGYGLSELVKYHPEVLDNLQEILNDMRVVSSSKNRVNLESKTHKAGVRLTWDGERKSWLLTAFKKETSASDKRTDTAATSLEGDTALSQTEGSAAKIDNSSETAKENGEKFSLKDEKIKSVAEKFGVNEDDVAMYANAVERGSTADAARARANIKRYLLQANEDKISSFKDIIKYTKPINEALKENFGDLDAMIEERRKQVEAQRNAMEAARKRAQEEEEKRQKHLDELSLIPTDELDKRYMDAIANNDESTAREMLDESARRNGYGDVDSDYQGQGAWAAPSNPQYESDEARRADIENSPDVNLEDIALGYNLQPDDYFDNPRAYMNNTAYGLESAHVIKNALDAIKNGEKDVKVKVYRAVPTSVKEGKLRNGDWVTPSKKYAEMHGDNRLEGKYRIIEDEVPANQLWWDGNDANEFGFDDGREYRYKNAKNNRKLNDLITYDNKGNVIPPSKRFNSRKNDIRFSLAGERGAAAADKAEERTIRMDNLSVAKDMEKNKKKAKAIKMATGWERGADGKWRYEMPDAMIKDTMDVGGGHIVKRYEDDMLWNGGKLSDVIDAPELFKAYPHLKDVRIETDAIMNDMPSNGEYNAKTNTITIHADELKYMNSILNHEIQHAIQSIEGFDRGGSPRLVRGEIKKRLAEVTKQIRQLRAEGKEDEAKAIVEKNRGLYNAYQANDDYNSYKSLAGEVEARNVQERMNMSPEERRRTLAESTEDVARKDQIFLGVGDVSFSLRDMADGKESGAADMAEDLKSLNTPGEVDDAINTAIDDMPSGWQMANKKMIHIAQALGENRKAEIAGKEPKFSLKDGTLIKAGTYFSGGGLVEEGLKGIIDPVVAVEYDEKISGVYRNNFGQHIVTADVRDVDPKELVKQIDGEVEYFHASPVCKNYSQAKSNHAEVELDKETAASTAEFINAVKPKVVTIENVKGYKDSEAMKIITDALDANGYTWDADVYNAADFGGYTNRERLIVRAVRDGKLPAKPEKMAHKSGWYEAVADIIPTLTEKKNGVAPWMDIRLKADGIDWRNIDKPLYVMGSAYADGKIPHAFADELLPTLRTKSGDVIVMPDGKVYRAMGRVLARVSGVSDDYKMPFSENLSHTIIGNGIPTQLTEHVIAPLLTVSDPKFSLKKINNVKDSRVIPTDVDKNVSSQIEKKFDDEIEKINSETPSRDLSRLEDELDYYLFESSTVVPTREALKDRIKYFENEAKQEITRQHRWDASRGNSGENNANGESSFALSRSRAAIATYRRELAYREARIEAIRNRLGMQSDGEMSLSTLVRYYKGSDRGRNAETDRLFDKALDIVKRLGVEFNVYEGADIRNPKREGVSSTDRRIELFLEGMARTELIDNDFTHTILHEMLHQATVGSINLVKKGKAEGFLTPKQIEGVNEILEIYDKVKDDKERFKENTYGLTDAYELTAQMADLRQRKAMDLTIWDKVVNAAHEFARKGDRSILQRLKDAWKKLFEVSDKDKMDKAINDIMDDFKEKIDDISMNNIEETDFGLNGNTRFSLRYDKFEHDLNQWKKDNNLPKDAQRPTIPQRNAGESAVDFLKRVDEYRKQMALWKTAPTYEQHLLSDDTALGEFNRELQKGSVLKRIAFQDSMLAIRKAQEAIMKEVGVDRLNMAEDAYTAENRSHGKGKNEFEEYNNEFLQPLRKAYHQMKKVLGDSYDNVRVYMMAKHGLERDAQMAFKKSLDADYEDVNQRSAAYKAYKNDLDRVSNDADLEFGRVDFTTWRQKDNALRGKYSPSYMDYRYDDNGIAYDYSGLSSLFDGSDFEEAAHKLVRDVETKHLAEVQALWNATNAATKKILRDGFKAGMMSKDAYEYVKGMYSHYIPLRGWDGTTADQVWDYIGGGKGAFNQTLKTAHGRTSIADDPIAYIENMAESGILLNNKNWVKQHLMLLAQNHPTSLITLSKAWYVKSTDANGNEEWIPATPQITSQMNSNQVKAAIDAFEQKMEQLAQTGDATQQRDGLNIAYPQTHSEEREHEVRVMKDGEEYVIYVNGDPQLAQAMNNTRAHRVREIQSGKLDRAAAWLGRKMAAAYTSLSPLFIPSNYFRDLTMTLASTAIREDGRYNYLLRKNLATSWNLGFMLKDYQNGKLRDKVNNGNATPKEQMFYDFMMNGGETGFVSSLDVEDLKKKFKNDLKDLDRWKANPVKVGHTIMDGIEFLNRMIEDSNRFAVYMTSIQYGRSIDEAVNDAKDVTLNFNRKGTGEYGWQMIRNLYLFINPAVQSLQTLGALTKHHPFKFTAVTAAWLASGVLVPIVNAALMSLLGGDDDKDKYWQFSKWDRRNNAIMWIPFTNEYVKIPLAQEFRAFYGIGDMIASKMMGGELAEETWSQYAEDLLGQVVDMLPLDPTGYDGNIAVSLMPNPIRPVFELAFNVDFTGKPLFKETEYNKYDPNFTKAYVGTPDWLVRVSKMVNSIGNDYPDVQQNAIDAFGDPRYNLNNPAVVDHVLSSYLGGAYTMGSQVLGVLTKSLNDPKEIKMADIPLVSKFVSNPDDRPVTKKQGDEFWNMKENHDRAANTLSKLKKQAKMDGDYSMLERFYGSEEYKQYKQEDVKVKKYEEDKKKERAEESGEEYRPHKLNAEDIYKAHATPKDDFEDLKLKQLYTKLNGFKTSYDLLVDTAPSQSDGYYNTNKVAIDAIDEISIDKQEISELKKGFLDDGKDAYNAEDMKRIRELRKRILSVLEPANKVVVANQKAKAEKK